MLMFKKNLMEVILQSPDSLTIEPLMGDLMQSRFKGTNSELTRFLHLLESDVNFQLRQNHSKEKLRNLMEALRVIKTDFNTTKIFYE